MGIQGLLPFLKKIQTPVNISQFEGCTVAIDAYCWLHKGAFSCADKLALGEKTDQHVHYCMKYVNQLLKKNVRPILVFDGCHLPSKKDVEKNRKEKRELYKKKAAMFLREGRRSEAKECLQRCVDITSAMALDLINVCRKRGVDCIVAPYEADAQLAYLNKTGVAQVIITEDSDLLLFGCDKIIFKMDIFGNGVLIEKNRLNEVLDIRDGFYTFEKFRYMCILSGCDYLPSLPGIGLAKACKVCKTFRQSDISQVLKKLPVYLKMNVTVSEEYIAGFIRANNTFLYQLTFDTVRRKLVPLNPYPPGIEPGDLKYAGPYIADEKATQIALGNIDICSGKLLGNFDPDTCKDFQVFINANKQQLHRISVWDRNYTVSPRQALQEIQLPQRPNLKGKEVTADVKKIVPRSPLRKRVREAEDCKEVKTDQELTSLYGESPVEKKLRPQQCSLFTPGVNSNMAGMKTSEMENAGPSWAEREETSVASRQKFLCGMVGGADGESRADRIHIRNKFVVIKDKKDKFDMNALKVEVKSRYFANTSDQQKPKTVNSIEGVDDLENSSGSNDRSLEKDAISVPEEDAGGAEEEQKSIKGSVTTKVVPTVSVWRPGEKSTEMVIPLSVSSRSAFSWSKFQLSRSLDGTKLRNSARANNEYKGVVTVSSLTRHNSDGGTRIGSFLDTGISESFDSQEWNENDNLSDCHSMMCNPRSNICSIGSEYLRWSDSDGSQEIYRIEERRDYGEGSSSNLDLEIEELSSKSLSIPVFNRSRPARPNFACRVSGLTHRRAKSQGKSAYGNKQQNIKDMFSRFARNKHTQKQVATYHRVSMEQ